MLSESAGQPTALLLAPNGRDAALAAQGLQSADLPCIICSSAEEMIEKIRCGAAPAVIVSGALSHKRAAALEAVLTDQPVWSAPPLILVAGPGSLPKHLHNLVARQNTTLLHRPLKMATFITTTRTALQNRLRQYEIQDLLHRLEDRARHLKRLASELTEAEERERQRLAEILHDNLQQMLIGAKLRVAGLPKQPSHDQFDKAVEALSVLLEQAVEQARSLSHDLYPAMLRQHGLPAGLQWLAEHMRQLNGLKVTVDADPDADPSDAWIRTFLYRSAQELLLNVIKHAGVTEAHMRLALEHDRAVLCVQDRGVGLGSEVRLGNAAGLGLLSIRERASLLGGQFEICSNKGMGSTFTLAVPLERVVPPTVSPEPGEAVTQSAPASTGCEAGNSGRRLRIMLVDDHRMMRSGLRSLLELEQDLEIIGEADDGIQALELVERLWPDLILMDVSMPRMDGIEATRRIKTRHPSIRVIGLSMFDNEQTAKQMRDAGAERYLPKTGPAKELLAALRPGSAR